MSLLISVFEIEKSVGDKTLFSELSFGLHEKQRVALLGPNGSGKSTLLKILNGQDSSDSGKVSPKRNLQMAYCSQLDFFPEDQSIKVIAETDLRKFGMSPDHAEIQAAIYLSMAGFEDLSVTPKHLSGGWKKRLSLAIAFACEPELLLLDEPTNHLDWEGIEWLEGQLKTFTNTIFMVSHDREFIKNQCTEFMEISPIYKDGTLFLKDSYDKFLEKRADYLESLKSQKESLGNKARRELDWLRAGVKARTTKSQSRIKEAHQLFDQVDDVKTRHSAASKNLQIKIESAGKKSKKLIELKELSIAYPKKKIVDDLNLLLGPNTCLGILGDNGSGKTSLLKVIAREAENFKGELFHADGLKIVYFDQKRDAMESGQSIAQYLGEGSDHVSLGEKSLHVAAYASQFRFENTKLNQPVEKLSGGERARLMIAKLLLQPADLLILDEPTNDLDIETIEKLEESLSGFPGAVLLVSHDRSFLSNTCNKFLALDQESGWEFYADLNQWLTQRTSTKNPSSAKDKNKVKQTEKVKLSYKEKKQWETIETDIAKAETKVQELQNDLDSNTNFDDHEKIQKLVDALEQAQTKLDKLYQTWEELEIKMDSLKN